MVFEKLKDKIKPQQEEEGNNPENDFIEIDEAGLVKEEKINVKIETLRDYVDSDRVQQLVRDGNIVFLKIKELRAKNVAELKRAVEKLKKTVVAMNGDIVGVDEDFLVITPNFARVFR